MFNFFNKKRIDAEWRKVSELEVGMLIAVPKRSATDVERGVEQQIHLPILQNDQAIADSLDSNLAWDEIESIKYVGTEQVWDIEVEDTHNFVGNNIFAHNTYLQGNLGVGINPATAQITVAAGSATAGTAPLKFTSGTNLTAVEAGVMEFDGTQLYFSPSTTRNTLAQISGSTSLTSGSIPFVSTSGYLTQDNANLFWDDSNNRLGVGTTTPTSKLDVTTNSLGVTQTNSSGLALINTTAATVGAQQISPALVWQGQGWKTDATASSQTVRFRADILPVQGSANASANWQLASSINGGSYTNNMTVTSNSIVKFDANSISIGNINTGNANDSNFLGASAGYGATSATGSNFMGNSAGYNATNASVSNFLGSFAGYGAIDSIGSNFLGSYSGYNATTAPNSNFFGPYAGYGATSASKSNFLGYYSGFNATGATDSNFLGFYSGDGATSASNSNFLGSYAGDGATGASNSNFLGSYAGSGATGSSNSNFFGPYAGSGATGASYSNLFGYNTGMTFTGNNLGSNNIIIGTNISLPNATTNAINLGGVLFATGTYGTTTGDPSIAPTSNGNVGIGIVSPTARLQLPAGTASASTAPLKFTSGALLTTAEAGAIEFLTNNYYGTDSSAVRRNFIQNNLGFTGGTTLIGGTATTDDLSFKTTSGVGATGADMHFLVGNNGATEAMTILNNGYVGIGTTGPVYALQVSGDVRANTFRVDGTGYIKVSDATGADDLGIFTNNLERLTVMTGGNVGIGTTAPAQKLDVVGRGVFGNKISSRGSYGNTLDLINETATNTSLFLWQNGIASAHLGFSASSSVLRIINSTSDGLITGSNGISILPSGNVGIGTTSPTSNLQVTQPTTGAGTVSNTAGGTTVTGVGTQFTNTFKVGDTITIGGQTVAIATIVSDTSMTTASITNANTNVAYTLAGGDRFVVKGNGNVGIGTTSPGALLHVGSSYPASRYTQIDSSGQLIANFNNNGVSFPIQIRNLDTTAGISQSVQIQSYFARTGDGTAREGGYLRFGKEQEWTSTPGTNDSFVSFGVMNDYSVNERMRITSGGNVGIGTTVPVSKLHVSGDGISPAATLIPSLTLQTISNSGGGVISLITAGTGINERPVFGAVRARGTLSSPAAVTLNDKLGSFGFYGYDGTAVQLPAIVETYVDGTVVGGSSVPARISFITGSNSTDRLERLTIKSTGNVGIGTTDPQQTLHISGAAAGSYIAGRIENTGLDGAADFDFKNDARMWKIGVNTSDDFRIRDDTGGINVMTIEDGAPANSLYIKTTSGNVGIGTTAPLSKLGVLGSTSIGATYGAIVAPTSGLIVEGNVGIGTSSPSVSLDVIGPIISRYKAGPTWPTDANGYVATYVLDNGGTKVGRILPYNGSTYLDLAIGNWNSGNPNIMLSSIGNVGIGVGVPTAKLHLTAGTASANTAPLKFTSGTLLTATEAGAIEFNNDAFYGTITTGAGTAGARKQFAFTTDLTTGYVPYTGANANVNLGTYSLTTPNIIGGSSTTQDLTFKTTTGVGATGADMHFLVGNNGATEAMTILNNGNVGIGTTTPLYKLDIRDGTATPDTALVAINNALVLQGVATAKAGFLSQNMYNAGNIIGDLYIANGSAARILIRNDGGTGSNGGVFNFQTAPSGTAGGSVSWTSRVLIDTNGNVGIGTTAPSDKFTLVNGNILVDSGRRIKWVGGSYIEGDGTSSLMTFRSIGNYYFNGGNVGIGTASPTSILALGGTSARTIQMERNTTAGTAGQGLTLSSGGAIAGTADLAGGDLTLKSGISTGTGSSALRFFTATAGTTGTTDNTPTEKMTILGNGNVGIGTTTPANRISAFDTLTDTSGYPGSYKFNQTINPSGASTALSVNAYFASITDGSASISSHQMYGQYNDVIHNRTDTLGVAIGLNNRVMNNSTGTIGWAYGLVNTIMNVNAGGVISNAGAVKISSPNNVGTLTNTWGLYIDSQTAGTQTNTPYAIYQAGTTDLNYFAGKMGIGNTAPGELLSLGTAGTTKGVLSFAGNTSGKVIIQPASTTDNYTLTLPTTNGNASEFLQTDGSGNLTWATASTGGVAWDAIGDPSGNGAIAMGATVQTMDWATATTTNALSLTGAALTTGKLLSLTSNSLTSGTLLDITSAGTAGLTNQKGLNIALSGTNSNSAQTTYGAYISNTHAGTTSTNVGLYATASGGTTANYAAIFQNGNVGIGTTTPGGKLDVQVASGGGPGIRLMNTSVNQGWMWYPITNGSNTDMRLYEYNTGGNLDRVTFQAGGNVGIGDTTPSALFTVGNGDLFQVSSAGAVTAVGVNSGTGLIQGTGGLTITGNTTLSGSNMVGASPLSFDGATADAVKTIFAITDPTTSSKTITFPNANITVNAAADISGTTLASGVVTSSLTTVGALASGSIATGFGNISTAGNISTTTSGTITSAGLLTASNGLTLTTGALNLTGTSGALTLSGLSASSISTGANALTITSSNFNTTATGINSTAIGATTASTGAFTSLTSNSTTTIGNGSGIVTTIGNTGGAAAVNINVGTGNFSLNGVAASTYTIGNTAQTGTITIGTSSSAGILNLATGAGASTVNIGTGATNAKAINIGTGAVANTIAIGSASATSVSITDNNWSVTAAGAATFVGVNSGTGLIQGTGGLTITGNTTLSGSNMVGASPLSFDGATADAVKTIFAITDPTTSSKTITFPNETGTVCTTGSVCSGYQASGSYLTTSTAFTGGDIASGVYNSLSLISGITRDTEWDSESEVQSAWGGVNILLETEIDASSELLGLMDDETGTGALTFNNSPTFLDDITVGTTGTATGSILMKGTTSGTVTLTTGADAGTYTLTLPNTDGDASQFLQTDGSGNLTWATASTGGVAWDAIGDPSGNGSIAMGATVQTMDWATATTTNALSLTGAALTTGKLLSLTSNSLTSGTLLDITSAGTAGLTNQKGLNIALSGTNATSAQTTYGAYISNTHAGTTSTNVGLYATASGGTTANYAAIFDGGNVGIGNTTPSVALDIGSASGSGYVRIREAVGGAYSDIYTADDDAFMVINPGVGGATPFLLIGDPSGVMPASKLSLNGNMAIGATYSEIAAPTNGLIVEGNVGIGTSSPTSILALGGTAARTIQMERNTTASTAGQGLTLSSGGAITGTADLAGGDLSLKSGISTGTGSSALRFFTATAGTTGTTDNTPTEKMTILGSGYVGIGTTAPRGLLDITSGTSNTVGDVIGQSIITGPTSAQMTGNLFIQSNDAQAADKGGTLAFGARAIDSNTNGYYFASIRGAKENSTTGSGAGYLRFNTRTAGNADSEAMRITSTGFVGVGTTAPASKLDITTNSLGVTQTNNSGLLLINNTLASSGAQQVSPAIRFRSQGWKTNATAASQPVDWRIQSLPVQGTTNPSSNLMFSYSINDSSYNNRFSFGTNGILSGVTNLSLTGTISGGTTIANSSTHTLTRTGLANTSTDGFISTNTTVALVGAQVQRSPRSRWSGTVWDTGASASRTTNFIVENIPTGGTNPGNSRLAFSHDYNGGGYSELFTIGNNGYVGIKASSPASILEIGSSDLGDGTAGPVITLGRNTNATNTGAGSINYLSKGGTAGFVWQDAAGNMRINTSAPSNANDTAGTVIGAQTSTRDTKQDIFDFNDYSGALAMIANAPIHTFRYIKEVNGYGTNSPLAKARIGFIADEVDPVFMVGNVIDQVSVNGLLMASVKEIDLKLKNLEINDQNIFDEISFTETQNILRLANDESLNWVAFEAPVELSQNVTWTLPSSDESGCFKSDGEGNMTIGSCGDSLANVDTFHATGAELAEIYETTDETLEAGDVVAIDIESQTEVKKTTKAYDGNTIGVVSTDPGLIVGDIGNQNGETVIVALSGQVPVKVNLENGPINKGDNLTPSNTPGVAMKATKAGIIIGQAMTEYIEESGEAIVVASIKTGTSNGSKISQVIPGLELLATPEGDETLDVIEGEIDTNENGEAIIEEENNTEIITPTTEAQKIALTYFLDNKIELEEATDISEIYTDRLSAALEIITPTVITDTLSTNQIVVSTGEIISFNSPTEFVVPPLFNSDTAGFAIIKEGDTKVTITYDKPYIGEPVVNANIAFNVADGISNIFANDIFMEDLKSMVVDSDQNGFTIVINKNAPRDLRFSWTAFRVKDPKVFESVYDGLVFEDPEEENNENIPADETGEVNQEEIIVPDTIPEGIVEEMVNNDTIEEQTGGETNTEVPPVDEPIIEEIVSTPEEVVPPSDDVTETTAPPEDPGSNNDGGEVII